MLCLKQLQQDKRKFYELNQNVTNIMSHIHYGEMELYERTMWIHKNIELKGNREKTRILELGIAYF